MVGGVDQRPYARVNKVNENSPTQPRKGPLSTHTHLLSFTGISIDKYVMQGHIGSLSSMLKTTTTCFYRQFEMPVNKIINALAKLSSTYLPSLWLGWPFTQF